ncbi:MAG: type II toxin-antitoxin system prevent-host-death family antitoxin [Gemmatimonadales bacterium]
MRDTYSLYEAKAKVSAIIRMVRDGRRVVVTVHGEPIVELKPIAPHSDGIKARMDELADRGILLRPQSRRALPRPVTRRPGALKRFLRDRS